MQYFVIRHKTTQRLLPNTMQSGSTWWDPEEESQKFKLPRLFASHKAAKSCIITWAKGHAVKKTEGSVSFNDYSDYSEWLEYEPVPGRRREQLEVIPVYLKFGEPL